MIVVALQVEGYHGSRTTVADHRVGMSVAQRLCDMTGRGDGDCRHSSRSRVVMATMSDSGGRCPW